jgi:hypothetical protein
VPNGEEISQELKPSERTWLEAGPARPHEPGYNTIKPPNIREIIANSHSPKGREHKLVDFMAAR